MIASPSETLNVCPLDASLVVKNTVPSNTPVDSFVSVTVNSIPPESESEYTSTLKFSTESALAFISGSVTVTTALDDDRYASSLNDTSPMFHLIRLDDTTVESSVYSKDTVIPSDSSAFNRPLVGPLAPGDEEVL